MTDIVEPMIIQTASEPYVSIYKDLLELLKVHRKYKSPDEAWLFQLNELIQTELKIVNYLTDTVLVEQQEIVAERNKGKLTSVTSINKEK